MDNCVLPVEKGYAPRYAPGLMAKVARNRKLTPESCMISRIDGPIGGRAWVHGVKTDKWLDCLIVDVSHPRDRARHIKTRRIIEISYENAKALCGSTRVSPVECPVEVKVQKRCNINGFTVHTRMN